MNYFFIDSNAGVIGQVRSNRLVLVKNYKADDIAGNIYRGRIVNLEESLNCAFVNIGLGKNAYLNLNELLIRKGKIEILEGEDLLVQVKKAPEGSKGAKITTDISIKGKYMVLLPYQSKVYISDRIKSKKKSEELILLADEIAPKTGMILRTEAQHATVEELRLEYESLSQDRDYIMSQKNFLPTPKLIYENNNIKNFILDNYSKNENIYTNDKNIYDYFKSLKAFQDIVILNNRFTIAHNRDLSHDFDNISKKIVDLSGGGNIVIEDTEALTVIDVNSSKHHGKDFKETVFETNIEAAREISRQIILRDISGIIIVDFINQSDPVMRDEVLKIFKDSLAHDKKSPTVHGYTALGLVEVSRRHR